MYQDFANANETEAPGKLSGFPIQENCGNAAKSIRNQNLVANFPAKLHYMLSEIKRDRLDHIISWLPHGRSFMVHKQKEFEQEILPL
jgi:HSF-type DNA-binding